MERLRVGVMGCSSFAQRAMIPALTECDRTQLVAVASRTAEKAARVAEPYGCESLASYEQLIERGDIDALYVPLPTGLHEDWCIRAIESGKHLLVEKSLAVDAASAAKIVNCARAQNRLVFENFQFQTHAQWTRIRSFMTSGEIGTVRLVRSTFGFPPLPKDNFRWNRELGGGALLDAGAYMAKISQLLLGMGLEVRGSVLEIDPETGVDSYGAAILRNAEHQVAQVAFGFDLYYQCRVELLGTLGKVSTDRVFTAPPNFQPNLRIETPAGTREEALPADNHYLNMWGWFADTIASGQYDADWERLLDQSRLLDAMRRFAHQESRRSP